MAKSTTIVKQKRRMGRPPLTEGEEPRFVGIKLPEATINAVDRWGEKKGVKRSEAIRRLIEQALAAPKRVRKD